MRLIGMLDSPYVRRVAISLEFLGVPFEQDAISVFSTYEAFQRVNPVVKAPTLVCDDGEVLMDSSLILQFVEATRTGGDSLWSLGDATRMQHEMRAVSLALAACEKSAQIVYERKLRPSSAQHEPWVQRVQGQLLQAYAGLEREVQTRQPVFAEPRRQASITAAVVWQFTQSMLAPIVAAENYPGLVALSARMERTPEFLKYSPVGPGV
ncbi:glutathione S-transferase-like protein [Rhodanobacter fulvus Jip2]|uniref:Glutathione S-transferase-like protein n=1 Tax=Rhodanobacter fulvus Jip2 TaxID=1163408 RepID=I4VQL5_9GAMM|nr:glutathione S-transferase N-terminal domain-containing protein [Rhodanobacter fulvus]EIL89506.1 glutathione S-transferase-like protein [Rhodanobacter fulvus Jip2]